MRPGLFKSISIILIILITIFSLSVFAENEWEDTETDDSGYYDEEYSDDYEEEIELPPLDYGIWPDTQYIIESKSAMMAEGAVFRQYFGDHKLKTELIAGDQQFVTIDHFKEDKVEEIVLLTAENKYFLNHLSYEEYLGESDSNLQLFSRTLPGEELAQFVYGPSLEKISNEEFLNRKVERWKSEMDMDGEISTAEFLVDRALRQPLKITIDGQVVLEALKIKIGKIPGKEFELPRDYQPYK